jgi:hypothetical protein
MGGWENPPRRVFAASVSDDEVRSLKALTAQRLAPIPARLATAGLVLLSGCATRPPSPSHPKPQTMPAELGPIAAPAPPGPLSLDTPIETICATPAGKAVLDHDLPGLTTRPEFAMFKSMTLKQLQPMSQGHITKAVLAKVEVDLQALNMSSAAK